MKFRRFLFLPLFLAACQAPGPVELPSHAPNYITDRDNRVLGDATAPGQFEVIARPGDAAPNLWCAAGEYADRALGQPMAERIYVVKTLSPSVRRPGTKSVFFTVRPTADLPEPIRPPNDFSTTVSRPGESMTIGAATNMCRQLKPRFPLFEWLLR